MERSRAFMSDEVWNIILHRYIVPYKDYNRHCTPTFIGHKDGEPLLNKKFTERLKDLSNVCPDMNIDIYSHGLMLPKLAAQGRDLFKFLSTLPNHVRYLMSYHPLNHDNTVNYYEETIKYLQTVLLNPPPNVEFITVSHKSKWVSEDTQRAWRECWEGLPITVHSNCSLNPWTGRIEEEGTTKFNGCPYGDFGHWFFGVTGNIIACCLDLEEEIVIGNVLKEDPEIMFNATEGFYRDQRKALSDGRKPLYDVCMNCFGYERPSIPQELISLGVKTS